MSSRIGTSTGLGLFQSFNSEAYTPPAEIYMCLNTALVGADEATYLTTEVGQRQFAVMSTTDIANTLTNAEDITFNDLPLADLKSVFLSDTGDFQTANVLFAVDLSATLSVIEGSGVVIPSNILLISFANQIG